MVITSLDEKVIKSGEKLLQQLDSGKIVVDAALWLYFPDVQNWKLLLSFPNIIQRGPKAAYEKVQKILPTVGDISFSLDDVAIAKDDAPLLKLMRTAIKTGPGINGIRFSNNVINGQLIQDAYVYRLTNVKRGSFDRSNFPATDVNGKPIQPEVWDKIGRNQPCPCGSLHPDGKRKKYKHCHGSSK